MLRRQWAVTIWSPIRTNLPLKKKTVPKKEWNGQGTDPEIIARCYKRAEELHEKLLAMSDEEFEQYVKDFDERIRNRPIKTITSEEREALENDPEWQKRQEYWAEYWDTH